MLPLADGALRAGLVWSKNPVAMMPRLCRSVLTATYHG